ncbi:MAG: hypothetical protein ABIO19_17540 [Burkholderiaceae bacterium]
MAKTVPFKFNTEVFFGRFRLFFYLFFTKKITIGVGAWISKPDSDLTYGAIQSAFNNREKRHAYYLNKGRPWKTEKIRFSPRPIAVEIAPHRSSDSGATRNRRLSQTDTSAFSYSLTATAARYS